MYTAMLNDQSELLLDYVTSRHQTLQERHLLTFVKLVDWSLRVGHLRARLVDTLTAMALDASFQMSKSANVGYLLRSASVLAERHALDSAENYCVLLALGILCVKAECLPKSVSSVMDMAVDTCPRMKHGSVSNLTIELLERLFGGLALFVQAVVHKHSWTNATAMVIQLLRVAAVREREQVLESMAEYVSCPDDLQQYVAIIASFPL